MTVLRHKTWKGFEPSENFFSICTSIPKRGPTISHGRVQSRYSVKLGAASEPSRRVYIDYGQYKEGQATPLVVLIKGDVVRLTEAQDAELHDPAAVARRAEASHQTYLAEQRRHALGSMSPMVAAMLLIEAGHNDPRALAKEVLDNYRSKEWWKEPSGTKP